MHCPGHQKEVTEAVRGNSPTDQAAKEAAKGAFLMPLVPVLDLSQFDPEFLTADLERDKSWGFAEKVLIVDRERIRKELYCFLNI